MMKTFYFVDGVRPDKSAKRLMRRHVMKGKNAGKKVHRASKLGLQKPQNHLRASENTDLSPRSDISLAKSCEKSFLAFSFPFEVSPDSVKIINEFFVYTADRIYPCQLGVSLHQAKLHWLEALFTDEATYNCNLALMQACNEIFLHDGGSPAIALYHLSRTLALVRNLLESENALSDSTIAIVISLIHQEQTRNYHSAATIHMKGLEKMVQLRGGFSQLKQDAYLTQKLCKTDILFALQQGGPTSYFRDRMPEVQKSLAPQGFHFELSSAAVSTKHNILDPYLNHILLDIMSICFVFNYSPKFAVGLQTFTEIVISLCYRLLRFRSVAETKRQTDIQTAYHLGLIIFMMTTFLQHDRRRIIDFKLISLSLADVVSNGLDEHEDEFVLWLTIVGGIWMSADVNDDLLASKTRITAHRLRISSWHEAQNIVSKFPWMHSLHDELGRSLWNRVVNGR